MSATNDDTIDVVARYLASDEGRDAPAPVAARLKCLPWRALMQGRPPDARDVHLLRGIIERNHQRRRELR